jgi:hypothetical protein
MFLVIFCQHFTKCCNIFVIDIFWMASSNIFQKCWFRQLFFINILKNVAIFVRYVGTFFLKKNIHQPPRDQPLDGERAGQGRAAVAELDACRTWLQSELGPAAMDCGARSSPGPRRRRTELRLGPRAACGRGGSGRRARGHRRCTRKGVGQRRRTEVVREWRTVD